MIELTQEQRRELENPQPLVIDPQTKQTFVLVRKEVYERWRALMALDEYNPDEGAAYVNEIMAEDDAHDRLLETNQNYGKAP